MPCFKGLAVSIHTPDGPLPEYSVQRQSRASRIASYIPVPPPKISDLSSGKPEQSTFAISITLLTPGMKVPYSTPKPTPENPHPKPKTVGGIPGQLATAASINPYQPLTASPNETIAAYIYFDGRQKEEVATLLRRGEETWVNSRWVGIPESEGGGLAEREFLFREVGLERWLNGLDLEGTDAAEKIERRRQKMEKRRKKKELREAARLGGGSDGETAVGMDLDDRKPRRDHDVLRYGDDAQSPVEDLSDGTEIYSSDHDSDDDPIPETAGQIKVALFRVLASGEIRRGEYSPQFDAHEDDEDSQAANGGGNNADIDHTTSFAKPKSLDPKSISTQTVTGIDPADRPYAVFTFMYRGERQLQKMGILKSSRQQDKDTEKAGRRKSGQPDFSKIGPLRPGGGAGFLNFRDGEANVSKSRKKAKGTASDMDSDDDEDDFSPIVGKAEDEEEKEGNSFLSPEDARFQGELAEGVRQIKLKRQHSSDPLSDIASNADATRPSKSATPASRSTPPAPSGQDSSPPNNPTGKDPILNSLDDGFVGSPLKKQRASLSNSDNLPRQRLGSSMSTGIQEAIGMEVSAQETNNGVGASTEVNMEADRKPGTLEEEQL
ncbi:hypothetical protein D8B26_003160 [Coccidioides posadasii str. Silveira]|uniref:DUF7918 domain-containing protein n=2 Tax=Coccidioides posadasii TaxID=199306 RepID=E9CZ20_COCPS|nr:hypothetical protein CPC735_006320 [Coccidioides posadasii C735 delta SOWgp]EER26460.1 hypothetical protein CPC735_006320 [Coccidioides posadasii C735 delta SOWgp]EFW20464.1 conserved hypothetical protein [Coccidioides posadasii str. Silveira]QVM08470.1 hypothetical protein D8B26_003160 [Coccidioides posadasii str. Silveira]|eukprot:XP_003068605.1 hypothetical protein CPC735_006320 [Coccidioides posadasii C735 delta SOWgp]